MVKLELIFLNPLMRKTNENPDGYTSDLNARRAELNYRALKFIQEEATNDTALDNYNNGRVDNVTFIVKGDPTWEWMSLLYGLTYDYIVSPTTPLIKINEIGRAHV